MIPKHLKLQNFLSHDVSEIDFERFNVALILGTYDNEPDQSNGAGKSAVFEAITWVLFDKSRHKKKDGVVKWNCRSCKVEFEFWIEEELYRIIRTRDKVIGESDVILKRFNGSEFISVDCDTNTATNEKIIEIINVNYEVFVNSVYFKQDDISMFATTTPSKRKDVLKALLKMSKWDVYQKKTKERVRKLEAKLEEKTLQIVPMLDIEKELEDCKNALTILKKDIKSGNELYSETNTKLITKKSEYQYIYSNVGQNDAARLKTLRNEFSSSKKRINEIDVTISRNNNTIVDNNNRISGLQQGINIFNEQIKNKKSVKSSLESLRSKLIDGRTKEKLLAEHVAGLKDEIKLAGKCNLCNKPLTKNEIMTLRSERKIELSNAQSKYEELKHKVVKATKSLNDREQIIADGDKAEIGKGKSETRISKLQNEINACLSENNSGSVERAKLKNYDFEKEINTLKARFDKDKEEELQREIHLLEEFVRGAKKKGDKLNIEYGSKIQRRDEIIRLQSEQLVLQKTINKLNGEFAVYDKLRAYFGKDGIQAVIIENVIEELENYSNDTLSMICNEPTSISIQTQKQNEGGSWVETFDISVKAGSRTDDFETFSGGEKFRISLALRLALSNILSKRMGGEIKFLLLDEVSSNLDSKGLDMFIDIVKRLSADLKILVITHNEKLKDRFEDIILVDKGPNGSRASMS